MNVIVDADVLIGALDSNDAHHAEARRLFRRWRERGDRVRAGVLNLTEALVAPAANQAQLSSAREALQVLGVTAHQPNEAIAVDAARLRGRHPISLADAYCLATARHLDGCIASFEERVRAAAQGEGIGSEVTARRRSR